MLEQRQRLITGSSTTVTVVTVIATVPHCRLVFQAELKVRALQILMNVLTVCAVQLLQILEASVARIL